VRSRITLAAQPPVNLRRLQEALQLLQLDPLFSSVQVELTAGTAPGLSVLTLNLKEAPPITSTLLAENRNPPSVGEIEEQLLSAIRIYWDWAIALVLISASAQGLTVTLLTMTFPECP
jgi:hemolysin activation/secretion protein